MSDCVGYECRFGARAASEPSVVVAMASSYAVSYAVDAPPSPYTAAAAARRRRPSRAARRRRRRRCRTQSSRRRRAATPTSSSSSRAVSCAEHHHPGYGGRSLPCFPGGTVALWLTFCPLFSPVYIYTTLSSTSEHARAERLDVLARPPDGLEHLRAFNRRAARLEREHRGVVARRVQDNVHGAPAAVDRNREGYRSHRRARI